MSLSVWSHGAQIGAPRLAALLTSVRNRRVWRQCDDDEALRYLNDLSNSNIARILKFVEFNNLFHRNTESCCDRRESVTRPHFVEITVGVWNRCRCCRRRCCLNGRQRVERKIAVAAPSHEHNRSRQHCKGHISMLKWCCQKFPHGYHVFSTRNSTAIAL